MRRVTPAGLAALAATAAVLLATSRAPPVCPPESGLVSQPVTFAVETTCGAPGSVVATGDPETCALTLEGAEAVGLPSHGFVDDGGRTLDLSGSGPRSECQADRTVPGEYAIRCYADLPESGCDGGHVPVCDGTLRLVTPP